jgi:hypothetical protein
VLGRFGIRHVDQQRTRVMKRRHLFASVAVCVTVAAVIGMFLWSETDSQVAPAAADAAANPFPGSILDGWGNRDMDIGAFGDHAQVRADRRQQELLAGGCHTGNTPGQQASPEPPRPLPATNAEFGIGSRVDGWANPDVDIGESR